MRSRSRLPVLLPLALLLADVPAARAQQPPRVEAFSPRGTIKKVRQVRARFSEPMVALGDPRGAPAPFDVECPEKATGRWVDSRNWVYDLERDLPAGVRCTFRLRSGLRALAGGEVGGERVFAFSTGGPAVVASTPHEGSEAIDETQVFVLELDGEATEASVLGNVWFGVEGIASRIGIRIVAGAEREAILKTQYRYRRPPLPPLALVQARQSFAPGARIRLVWGRGVATPGGVATERDQVLPYVVRKPFTALLSCERENADAACIPITPVRLEFSASVAAGEAKKAIARGPGGRAWPAKLERPETEQPYVQQVLFEAPFPERAKLRLELPSGLADDAGRKLANADRFPLDFETAEYPPLVKFAADFGVLELRGKPLLPVTLRNVEPAVAARSFQVTGGEGGTDPPKEIPVERKVEGAMEGTIFKVPSDRAGQMLDWIKRVRRRGWGDRHLSIFGPVTSGRARSFSVPKLHGPKAFEVVGIPLPSPGFYVVEIRSELLGASLLGAARPMYVPTTVLVTNLSVHFKWGIESSLVWVTTLDGARPVGAAAVQVRDCKGGVLWEGKTDSSGIARPAKLPPRAGAPRCGYDALETGIVVTAQSGDDFAFVHTSWNEGIEPWRFQVPTEYDTALVTARTVFDRSLFRAGETVHMKHVARKRTTSGFGPVAEAERAGVLVIQHLGSEQKYELPLRWDAAGVAENEWSIPREAKLGLYQVLLQRRGEKPSVEQDDDSEPRTIFSGEFRVEEYRVPLMRATIRPPSEPLVAAESIPFDLSASFLSGGPAANLPVKLRHQVTPRWGTTFDDFDDFTFAAGRVREGITRRSAGEEGEEEAARPPKLETSELVLDRAGGARAAAANVPKSDRPLELFTELEFRDPNGEVQTVASRVPVWPSEILVGLKPESWAASRERLKLQVAVADLKGRPAAGVPVSVELFERKVYSHRKRLVGGFYAYEHSTEVRKVGALCSGRSDRRGLVFCEKAAPVAGNLIVQATAVDRAGRAAATHQDIWIVGEEEWWFAAGDSDRIDLVPERRRYEPGERARFQVRMPFRKATALVTVEREGVAEAFVKQLSGREPVVELPIAGSFAPNVFVSVLVVRGRAGGVQPTATVDLGRPAYRLGIAEIRVGWRAHELRVKVTSDRPVYKVRETAKVAIAVATADGKPAAGGEVALAAVDEGLLELRPNASWQLLEGMMGRRSYGVETATAQMHVVGRRHFGLKALPQGGGGGRQTTRELFDTLLLWKGRVRLDASGRAAVEVPLNDSLTSFRIVAVAISGLGGFGTGSTSIQSTQDLQILSGLAPVVRQGDRFRAGFTIRNAGAARMNVRVSGRVREVGGALPAETLALEPGDAREIGWDVTVPATDTLRYDVEAAAEGASDRMSVGQKVVAAVPVRVQQATIAQIDRELRIDVERPRDAIAGRGSVDVALRPKLAAGLDGVADYMRRYPYTCLEQRISRAVALRDRALWDAAMARLPAHLDSDGLAKYFPSMTRGSDVLTAYILSIAHEARWPIPEGPHQSMVEGLKGFVTGRVVRYSSLPTADLAIRKVAALDAMSRTETIEPALLQSIAIEPNLWPTSAVLDWHGLLTRAPGLPQRAARLGEADQILRSRVSIQGTRLLFSTERNDGLWWLMTSADSNAVRLLLALAASPEWRPDVGRMVTGALGRQLRGHWDTTVANAWGVLAMEKFSSLFENVPVTGTTSATLGSVQSVDWRASPEGKTLSFPWPAARAPLEIRMAGTGRPWTTIQSRAAVPLQAPRWSGFTIRRSIAPIEQKTAGRWSRGDVARIRLDLEASADMTWVVVDDPIPAGASILGTGLGRDSRLLTRGEDRKGWIWPAFEERSLEAFRAYYEFVPKGSWSVEYTIRLNNEGTFQLPTTRLEALYAPEMFGELPNAPVQVR